MKELKKCPFCGGQTMLCQNTGMISCGTDFSIICLECGIEFRFRYNPQNDMMCDPAEAAKRIIEKFNRRVGSE